MTALSTPLPPRVRDLLIALSVPVDGRTYEDCRCTGAHALTHPNATPEMTR